MRKARKDAKEAKRLLSAFGELCQLTISGAAMSNGATLERIPHGQLYCLHCLPFLCAFTQAAAGTSAGEFKLDAARAGVTQPFTGEQQIARQGKGRGQRGLRGSPPTNRGNRKVGRRAGPKRHHPQRRLRNAFRRSGRQWSPPARDHPSDTPQPHRRSPCPPASAADHALRPAGRSRTVPTAAPRPRSAVPAADP